MPAIEIERAAASVDGLYVHTPFCVRKCRYCDFYSLPKGTVEGGGLPAPVTPDERYLDALERELAGLPAGFAPRTIFVGGGTPTELDTAALSRLLDLLGGFAGPRLEEWTVESNPGTLTPAKAALLKEKGVTRVSLGVQSFDPEGLAFLGRIHSGEEAEAGYRLLREVGFANVNLDLIYGIPGAARAALERDLDRIAALAPDHVSCYCLIFEPGTPLHRQREQGLVAEVDDEEELAQYRLVRERLARAGYEQYEISNFARPGRECRHNLLYWGPGTYHGVGPSAHSHVERRRWANVRDLGAYCSRLEAGLSPVDEAQAVKLPEEAWAREALVMALRRTEGVSRARFRMQTGFDTLELAGPAVARYRELGFMSAEDDVLKLTEAGLFVSDAIFSEIV